MTGFKLTWRIEKPISNRVARNADDTSNNHEYEVSNIGSLFDFGYDYDSDNNSEKSGEPSHNWLVKMVKLAYHLRIKEKMTEEQILDKVVREKMQNLSILDDH